MSAAPPSYEDVTGMVTSATGAKSDPSSSVVKDLQGTITNYRPGETIRVKQKRPKYPPEATRIGLFGGPGVGKSALINSMLYATDTSEKPTWRHMAPESYQTERSMTMKNTSYDLTEHLTVCDNRGMVHFGGKYMTEVKHQLAGARGDGSDVVWDHGFFQRLVSSLDRAWNAKETFKIHCAVIVVSAEGLVMKPSDMKELIKTIICMTGQPPIVVITHRDSAPDPMLLHSFKAGLHEEQIEYVHEIENYTKHDHAFDAKKHEELLEILDVCTTVADRVMVHTEEEGGCTLL